MSQNEAEASISGQLLHKSGVIGLWRPYFYWLIGNTMHVSKTSNFDECYKSFEITRDTKIVLIDSKKSPHFYIENDEIGKYLLKSKSAEVYSWVYNLRNCQFDKNEQGVKFTMDQFRILSVLGRGFYGKVMLVEKLDTGSLYALKTIKKSQLQKLGQVSTVMHERNLLGSIPKHPFIINLVFTFQTNKKFYLGLEYAAGGELLHYLMSLESIPVEDTKLYIAEIALALDHLHKHQIVYRDLKPENVLLDKDGHIKLADFGLAKRIEDGVTSTFCGTAEYLAPEIITRAGYSFKVDWWSLGILLYEILYGETPFYHPDQKQMFTNIIEKEPKLPKFGHKAAIDLIRELLNKDPTVRPDFERIKVHPFFRGIDWDKVYEKKIKPASFAGVNNELDPDNFSSTFTKEPLYDSNTITPSQANLHDVDGFSMGPGQTFREIESKY